jgi:ATP synthase F1 gamma subunit
MRPLSELKLDLEVSRSLGDIVDVLKTAAMIQFHSFQAKKECNADFGGEVETCFSLLAGRGNRHPYLIENKTLPYRVVIVTSDEGFVGELNTLLIHAGLNHCRSDNDEIIVLGERGARYLEEAGRKFIGYPAVADEIKQRDVQKLTALLLNGYGKKFGRLSIVYPEFFSLTVQRVKTDVLLPYLPEEAPADKETRDPFLIETVIEPSVDKVFEKVFKLWLTFTLIEIFASSKQSEFAARIMHLEGSTQELSHLNQKISLEYFKQVHFLRDKVIREISASKILLGKRKTGS